MPVSDRQYRRLHQSSAIPYAWAREAARRLDLGRVDHDSMTRLPVGLIKDGGPGKVRDQEHIPDALWSFSAEKSDLVMLAFEFQRQRQWYFALRLALYLFVHIVSLCESREVTRKSGIPLFVMVVTYTGARPWVLADGNELWTDAARRYMAMPVFPILYYDVHHCDSQDLPDTAELRIMMEGERRMREPYEHVDELARAVLALKNPESRDVLARFLSEFGEHWPRYMTGEGGRRVLVDVKWDQVQTAEEFDMAANLYSEVYTGLRDKALAEGFQQGVQQGIQQGVQQGVQQGIQQGVQQGVQQGIQQVILKILGTVLEQGQLADLETVWQQSDWYPDLDDVLAVRDGVRTWTSLFPPETPSQARDNHHDG